MVLRFNPEKKEEKERVAHTLLRATLRLASAHGFASLGLREVAREASIAPTSFYRHFPDMEQLGLTLIADLVGPFVSSWLTRGHAAWSETEGDDPAELVLAVATHALAGVQEDAELMRFLLAERSGSVRTFRRALAGQFLQLSKALQQAFRKRPKSRVLPMYAADALVVLMLDACARALEEGLHKPALGDELRQQLQLLLRVTEGAR